MFVIFLGLEVSRGGESLQDLSFLGVGVLLVHIEVGWSIRSFILIEDAPSNA